VATRVFFPPLPGVFTRSFRAEKLAGLGNTSAGIKNVASPRWQRACGSPSRREGPPISRAQLFSIKAPELSPKLNGFAFV